MRLMRWLWSSPALGAANLAAKHLDEVRYSDLTSQVKPPGSRGPEIVLELAVVT